MFKPKQVIFEKGARDFPLGEELYQRFVKVQGIEVAEAASNRVKSVIPGDTLFEQYRNGKETLVVGVKKSLKFQSCKPSAHYQLPLVSGCMGQCEYCYLNTQLGDKPFVRVHVNVDDILGQAMKYITERLPETRMNGKKRPYFEGRYYKHEKGNDTVSIIPGAQIDEDGNASAFVQVIARNGSYYIPYPMESYEADRRMMTVKVGKNRFTKDGMVLAIHTEELNLGGKIRYGAFQRISYDIMGPFQMVPFMPCRHQIVSMKHALEGELKLNGEKISFFGGTGYIEGDCGNTFPKNYFWSQSNSFETEDAAIFAAAADVHVPGLVIPGCIAIVKHQGKEIRFATYLGARIRKMTENMLCIRQGRYELKIKVEPEKQQMLYAPVKGKMIGKVKESIQCRACYELTYDKKRIFRLLSLKNSFERVLSQ